MAHLHVNNLIEQKEADPFKKEADPFKKEADPFKKEEDPFKKKEEDPFKKKEEDPFKKGSGDSGANTSLTGDDLKGGKAIKIGMRGDIVGQVQDLLIKLGYVNVSKDNKRDNIFGPKTEKMVKDFQKNNGLNDDGVVGKDTWPKLNDPAAVKNSASSSSSALGSAKADVPKDGETTAGTDAIIIKEALRKSLRKNLLKFN